MERGTPVANQPAADPAAGSTADADNVIRQATGWLAAIRDRAHVVTELAVAEARLAVISVGLMTFLAVLAALCVFGAMGLILAAVVQGLEGLGLPYWAALACIAGLLLAAAALLWRRVLSLSSDVEFSATRREMSRERDLS